MCTFSQIVRYGNFIVYWAPRRNASLVAIGLASLNINVYYNNKELYLFFQSVATLSYAARFTTVETFLFGAGFGVRALHRSPLSISLWSVARCSLACPNHASRPLDSFLKFSSLTISSPRAVTSIWIPKSLACLARSRVLSQSGESRAVNKKITFCTLSSERPLVVGIKTVVWRLHRILVVVILVRVYILLPGAVAYCREQ